MLYGNVLFVYGGTEALVAINNADSFAIFGDTVGLNSLDELHLITVAHRWRAIHTCPPTPPTRCKS